MPLFLPIENLRSYISDSIVEEYFIGYLEKVHAACFSIEENYIDKDFLIDYANYYSRAFRPIRRETTRIHFFSSVFEDTSFFAALNAGDSKYFRTLAEAYLGFTVIKPIRGKDGEPIVGRTLLKTFDPNPEGAQRSFIGGNHTASLFGIPLSVTSLPFQTQDMAVGACATIACWTALHQLAEIFDIPRASPYELTSTITNLSTVLPSRNFPSIAGLTLSQLKSYFISLGLETEFIDSSNIVDPNYDDGKDDVIADAVRAYQEIKLPIIAALVLTKRSSPPEPASPSDPTLSPDPALPQETDDDIVSEDYHAVVISGYRAEGVKVTGLYVHDDRIGPYSRCHPVGNFSRWKNEWISRDGFDTISVAKLLIPIYPKVRLNFPRIYSAFLDVKRENEKSGASSELFLTTVKLYKEFLLHEDFDDKEKILIQPMPKYLWIIRASFEGAKIFDIVYDGTSIFPDEHFLDIDYRDLDLLMP